MAFDMRNTEDRHPEVFQLQSAAIVNSHHVKNNGWQSTFINPALAGTFGAGANAVFAPSHGPRGTLSAVSGNQYTLSALAAAVGVNQLAGRGDGRGYKMRIINNVAGGGTTFECIIFANSSGTTPVCSVYGVDANGNSTGVAPVGTALVGAAYEIYGGRLYMLSAGVVAAGYWKAYDQALNTIVASLSTTNLVAPTVESNLMVMDELYVPSDKLPGQGFFGNITSTGTAATSITGAASGAGSDFQVLANEFRNFQIRIVTDATTPLSVGQRRKITSHTAGASPVYTVPTWTTTPSSGATFVIENANEILMWSGASTTTFTYCWVAIGAAAADSWTTTTYAVRGTAMGAGGMTFQPSGVASSLYLADASRNFRYSQLFAFRGGATNTLDVFDIAGAATGSWASAVTYGSITPTFTTGTSGAYDAVSNNGLEYYIQLNGSNVYYRFNAYTRNLNTWTQLRFSPAAAALVGQKMAMTSYIDPTTPSIKMGLLLTQRHSAVELFDCILQR
jgi:hypothetical protein